jgi:hypothetical protein
MIASQEIDTLIQCLTEQREETMKALKEARLARRKATRRAKLVNIKANAMPSLQNVRERYRVDAESPSGLTRIKSTRGPSGRVGHALGKCSLGLWRIRIDGTAYRTARIVYFLHTGNDPLNMVVIHKDGNKLNNAPSNLIAIEAQDRFGNLAVAQ